MGLALGRVQCNGPFIEQMGTLYGTEIHEIITNVVTPYLQPSKWKKSAL
jgi:hypothetical protein